MKFLFALKFLSVSLVNLLILLGISLLLSNCGRKTNQKTLQNKLYGIISFEGSPVSSAYITNLSKKLREKSDTQGRFSIIADKGDKILFESDDKSLLIEVGEQKYVEINLKPNMKKIFHLKNFESYLFEGEILVFIPSTKFISPVLSDGRVIFLYPDGVTEALIFTRKSYSKINILKIEDFSFLDLNELEFHSIPESITFVNASDKEARLFMYSEFITKVSSGDAIQIKPGIYSISFGENVIENEFLINNFVLNGGMLKKDEPELLVEGSAKTKNGEGDILIWVEGTGIISKSTPNFSIKIPTYSKRIHFSKFGWYPYSAELMKSGSIPSDLGDVELPPQAYISGSVSTFGSKPEKIQIDIISKKDKSNISSFVIRSTDFSIVVPQGEEFLLNVSSAGYIPKILEIYLPSHYLDVGTIYLCLAEDERCSIEEGKRFLKYGMYRKARDAFSYSKSIPGKIGLFLSDIGILLSEENFFELSERSKRKSLELSDIYSEAEELSKIQVSEPLCVDDFIINLPFLGVLVGFSGNLYGCVGQKSFEFFRSIYHIIKFIRNYVYSHKLFEDPPNPILSIEPEKIFELTRKLISDEKLLTFSEYDPDKNIENLKQFFSLDIRSLQDCNNTNEMLCNYNGFMTLRLKTGYIPIVRDDADLSVFIKSLNGDYELSISDIAQIIPIGYMLLPDFMRINLKKLLSNSLRKFLPSILDKDSGKVLGMEIEIPSGFRGIMSSGFINDIFVIGDSKHFRVLGKYLISEDSIFPNSSTTYFDDPLKEDIIIYFYFDDPDFNESIKLSPCKIALNELIYKRYSCPDSNFKYPDNQMLNDVLASIQKTTGILKLLFGSQALNIFNTLFRSM